MIACLVQSGMLHAENNLSYEQKIQVIDSLRVYESQVKSSDELSLQAAKKDIGGGVAGATAQTNIQNQSPSNSLKVEPFSCDEESEHSCELQEFMHEMENGHRVEKSFVSDGKYKVTLAFDNDKHFPIKYFEKKSFENVPESEHEELQKSMFEHYLGSEYLSYAPELINSYHNVVSISVLVASSDELNTFLDDSRIQGIHHIGNSEEDLEEGYH